MKRLVMWLCLLLPAAGCLPKYYAPNALNVPMIGGKGEGAAAVHFEDENGLDVQAAYSPIPNIGVTLDVSHVSAESSASQQASGRLVEGGVGYYRPIRRRLLWDIYGLIGIAGLENRLTQGDISANLIRFGIQPSAGFRSKFFDAFLASRLVGLHYFKIDGSDVPDVQFLRGAGMQYLFEPVLTLRAGYRLKVQAQVGQSYNLSNDVFPQENDILTWGLVYTFGRQ